MYLSSTQKSSAIDYVIFKGSKGIWNFFLRNAKGSSSKCTLCSAILNTKGGSTGSLHNHLHTHRDVSAVDIFLDSKSTQKDGNAEPVNKLSEYFSEKESFACIISRMACLEHTPFSRFSKSKDIRSYFLSQGYKLTHSGTQIRETIINYANEKRKSMGTNIQELVAKGDLLSLTMDEWTSVSQRRYANVNVHVSNQTMSLGLWRCYGSMPAAKCKDILEKVIGAFGIEKRDVVGLTTDAAPVMVAMGKFG